MTLVLNGSVGVSDVDGSAATPAIRGTDANTGMFFPAADTIAFAEGGAEVMRIDSAGNVGIGTSSPSGKLDVVATSATSYFNVRSSSIANSAQVVQDTGGTAYFQNTYASGDVIFGTAGNNAIFKTSSTERARIDTSGNLLVGATTSAATFRVYAERAGAQYGMRHPSATAGRYFFIQSDSNNDLYVQSQALNGVYLTNTGTSWLAVSDERLKENLNPIKNAADKVSTLRAVTGKYKTDEDGVSRSFLIAQDVQAVLPEAVSVKNDDEKTLGLSYTDVIPLLVAAIQELKAENDALKARVEALENV